MTKLISALIKFRCHDDELAKMRSTSVESMSSRVKMLSNLGEGHISY